MQTTIGKGLYAIPLQAQAAHQRAQGPVADDVQHLQLRRTARCVASPHNVPTAIGPGHFLGVFTHIFRHRQLHGLAHGGRRRLNLAAQLATARHLQRNPANLRQHQLYPVWR